MMCRCEPLHSSGYGHMADGFGAGGAVHRTACSWISMACRPLQASGKDHWWADGLAHAWPTESVGSRENSAGIGVSPWTGSELCRLAPWRFICAATSEQQAAPALARMACTVRRLPIGEPASS
jgi:hypothetical protein